MKEALNLYQRIAAVMEEAKYVQKTGYNDYQKYSYAKETDYIATLRPVLLKHGLLMLPVDQKTRVDGKLTTVEMQFKLINIDNPDDYVIIHSVGQGADNGDKGAYKAQTGAKKYAISLAFLFETGDDAEATENDFDAQETKKAAKNVTKTEAKPETKAPTRQEIFGENSTPKVKANGSSFFPKKEENKPVVANKASKGGW